MSAVAIERVTPTLVGGASDQLALLRAAQTEMLSADAYRAADVAEQARLVREWVRITKAAADLAVEATRLECIALRRLAQVDAAPAGTKGNAARRFASLTDAEFVALLDRLGPWSGALGAYRLLNADDREDSDREWGRAIGRGEGDEAPVSGSQLRELALAAAAMLHDFTTAGRPFSVTEVADEIAADYLPSNYGGDPIVREALREVVLDALHSAAYADVEPGDFWPPWITYQDADAGWIRVPWSIATLDQLGFMVDLRRQQRDELAAALARLEAVREELAALAAKHPGIESCQDLMRLAS